MAKPVIAIVGRPNVGKSTLFNKLTGKRISIVDDTPGVTRDRIFGEVEWGGRKATLIDTGGIEPYSDDIILSQMRRQAELAIDSADVIILVTDLRSGVVATDMDVAAMLQKSGRPIVLCVNKCDKIGEPEPEFYEFYNLGLGDPVQVSSVHGHGTGDLLEQAFSYLPDNQDDDDDGELISVAVIGKPNVGKSSLINKISGEERCIVSNIAGTTRDSIDTLVENEFGLFNFIDTAGLRRKNKVDDKIEQYSVIRAKMAVERCDVCVIMINAEDGFTEQDSKVAGLAHEAGKACIIAVNKWDAIEKNDKTMNEYKKKLDVDFSFMSYAPMIFISAKTGQRLDRLFELIKQVANSHAMRIRTGKLNELLSQATLRVQPPSDKGKRLKIYYMTQASTKPPTFVCFVNNQELFHFSYQRYLENRIRETFGLEGTPIRFVIRERGENAERS
ncbi:MAG: ribosome biogenesis GTPase Der [Acutalibacteraceae bacterium]